MSDTPQSDAVESEVTDQPVTTNDSVVESDTTSQVQAESEEQVDEVEVAKKKANDAFNKQYGQLKQAERDRDANKLKLDELEKAERERQAAAVGDIPPIPDALDDDFEEKMRIRDAAIVAQTNHTATNDAWIKQQETIQQQSVLAQQQEQAKVLQGHNDRVKAQGIDANEMIAAENTVLTYNIDPSLVSHIASLKDSPNIIRYLAANPQEGYNLAAANTFQAADNLAAIRVKAEALKPKQTETPKPVDRLSGNGAQGDLNKFPNSKGAKFS